MRPLRFTARVRSEHHEQLASREESPRASDRSVGLVLAGAATVLALAPLLRRHPARPWALVAAALLLLLAVVRPRWLRPLNRVWTAVGTIGNTVMTWTLMALVFYGVVTPLGWLLRSLGHDFLRLERDPAASTYWLERRTSSPPAASLKNQF